MTTSATIEMFCASLCVGELNEAKTVVGNGHADHEEQHKARQPEAIGDAADDDADDDEHRTEQDSGVDREGAVASRILRRRRRVWSAATLGPWLRTRQDRQVEGE